MTKGHLISKCPFGVDIWTKIPIRFVPGFLPYPLLEGEAEILKKNWYFDPNDDTKRIF